MSQVGSEGATADEETNGPQTDEVRERLLASLDQATEKSAQGRCEAIRQICTLMQKRYVYEIVEERKMTLQSVVERGLKRGKAEEQRLAAQLSSLLIVQLGDEDMAKQLCDVLVGLCQDKTVAISVRTECCHALALLTFLSVDDTTGLGDLFQLMRLFEDIFEASYQNKDGSAPSISADVAQLHSAALSAWTLLLSVLKSSDVCMMVAAGRLTPNITKLRSLLESQHLSVQLAAGEAIAMLLESGRFHEENFLEDNLDVLLQQTKRLATSKSKFVAKKDSKVLRATFRDVLAYLDDDVSPNIIVRFNDLREVLLIETWSYHHLYVALCSAIGPGITTHFTENEFLRDVLQLGPVLLPLDPAHDGYKPSKFIRVSKI